MLTQQRLKEVLHYDLATGVFRWLLRVQSVEHPRANSFNATFGGKQAGGDNGKGYIVIEIDGRGYKAHRLGWLYVYGVWPSDQIDHRDRNKKNNAISNLRDANNSQNLMNAPRKRRVAPYRGLGYSRTTPNKPWHAKINTGSKIISLGYFATPEEAHAAYCDAAEKHHGEFASFD
jgi:hypothetical protein